MARLPKTGSVKPSASAAGPRAVAETVRFALDGPGPVRGLAALSKANQPQGFDCPGCAWPDDRPVSKTIDFCENGAKAIADEATRKLVGADFFRRYSIRDLAAKSGRWLNDQGRLGEPMVRRRGATHYEPISWDAAYELISSELRALDTPDEAVFYTSGRTSNEAAFLYQLFVRCFGTNNLPDSSNLCHESSGIALIESLGNSKGSVRLKDFDAADAIFIFGQNPGSNHPRMLATLQKAKRRGARIVSINPLEETGLQRYRNPQELSGYVTGGTRLADLHVPVRINGDVALVQGFCKALLEIDLEHNGQVLDYDFITSHSSGFDAFRSQLEDTTWDEIESASGIDQSLIRQVAAIAAEAESSIACWAMGMTQHQNAVANIQQITNFMLMRGNIGRAGAGVCPVRGHSNVQGDRTMGITDHPRSEHLDALRRVFGIEVPAEPGLDAVAAIQAMARNDAKILFALGGNFVGATSDPGFTETAVERCRMTVQVSTKLNRSHVITGEQALILPTLGRTDRDMQGTGPQQITCENSMGIVSSSAGVLSPRSAQMRSEVRIVSEVAAGTLDAIDRIDWLAMADDYRLIRDLIEATIPGFDNFNDRIETRGYLELPHPVRDERRFETTTHKARFMAHQVQAPARQDGEYLMMTIRSHDQFNTSVYSDNDRYRGIHGTRQVALMNPGDIAAADLRPGQPVDLTSHYGRTRRIEGFIVVPYPIPGGCIATYYPEANPLIPIDHVAERSNTPAYKSVLVRIAPAGQRN